MITILIVILIVLLIGALPTWPYSSGWGYYPGGLLGAILFEALRDTPVSVHLHCYTPETSEELMSLADVVKLITYR